MTEQPETTTEQTTEIEGQLPLFDQHEDLKEQLRPILRDLILAVRGQFLASGGNPMTHWDRIQAVFASQSRQSTSVKEWFSRSLKFLQLSAPDGWVAINFDKLTKELGATKLFELQSQKERFLLSMISEELTYLLVISRMMADENRATGREKRVFSSSSFRKDNDAKSLELSTEPTEEEKNAKLF